MSTPQRTITMSAHRKRKSNERNQRHGAAWGGGRFLLLALILVANQSFDVSTDGGRSVVDPRSSVIHLTDGMKLEVRPADLQACSE